MGDEARDTFQVSCNEFRSTIWEVCTGKNQFGTRMTCRGTHQVMPWAAHGLPWHTPRHVMAAHGWPWHTKAAHCKPWQPMGWPWHTQRLALAPHGLAVAHTKACRGRPWLAMGRPWHTPRHFLKQYLGFGRDILHTCLEKSYLQACQVLRFFEKNIFFFNFFN